MEKQNTGDQSPKLKTGRWTRAEHNKFMQALQKHGRNWTLVQKKVKTRSLLQIRSHAQKVFLNLFDQDIDALVGYQSSSTESRNISKDKKLRNSTHPKNLSLQNQVPANQQQEKEVVVNGNGQDQGNFQVNQTFGQKEASKELIEYQAKNFINPEPETPKDTQEGSPNCIWVLEMNQFGEIGAPNFVQMVWTPLFFYSFNL